MRTHNLNDMPEDTLRTRVFKLLQKSRQAVRLYASLPPEGSGDLAELHQLQSRRWRDVNSDLVRNLTRICESGSSRLVLTELSIMRDKLLTEFRELEVNVHDSQNELTLCSEKGDYIRSTIVAKQLVSLKAYHEALHAAIHEVEGVLPRSGYIVQDHGNHEANNSEAHDEALNHHAAEATQAYPAQEKKNTMSNVIPLRRMRA